MRIEVGAVRTASRATVGLAATACVIASLHHGPGPDGGAMASACALHGVAAYALTFLGFAAFPFRRRADLVKIVILAAAIYEITKPLLGRDCSLALLMSDVAGVLAVFAPSFMERFRSLTRADPHEPFSMVYPDDRRRRSLRDQRATGIVAANASH